MKHNILCRTVFISFIFSAIGVDAQIRINLPKVPKIPKIEKDRPNVSNPVNNNPTNNNDAPNGESWFSALSRFRRNYDPSLAVSPDRAFYIAPYLSCYAQKHGLDEGNVGYFNRQYDRTSEYDRGKLFKQELSKLAELEREFKKMFPSSPNNGKSIDDNPAIWNDILTNREEYYQCAVAELPSPDNCDQMSAIDKARTQLEIDDLKKLLAQVSTFTKDRGWYSGEQYEDYLLAAISPKKRAEMRDNANGGRFFKCYEPLLDQIKAEAAKTLPNYTLWSYNVRNPADERVLRSAITDLSSAKVYKIGLGSATWTIQKNSIDIPEKRYKHGAIWVKYPTADSGYCQILWINLIQEYTGGGTWGRSYGYFTRNEPAGCPAGK